MKFVQHPNLKITFIIAIIIFLSEAIQAQDVIKTKSPEGWLLKTNESVYQMVITGDKKVRQVYYGTPEQKDYLKDNALWTNSIDEVPVRGGLPFKMPVAEVIFADGVRDLDLIYDSDEIYQENGKYILKIIQKDSHYPIKVISHFKVYKEHDIIEKWITIENQDRENAVLIENLLSGSIVLPHNEYILTYLSGTHMHEFQEQKMLLTPGLKTIESRAFKSNANAPWFMVSTNETDKHQGPVWFGDIHYSGNWSLLFDKTFSGTLQIVGGINFWDTEWKLLPGESFTTPKITFGYSMKGSDQASINLSNYIREHLLPINFREEIRPVLYNSWEATYYDVNEKQQMELAEIAKKIGIELFVVDDGWFKDRTDGRSTSGLGNFDVDTLKFPNGLKPLIEHVHNLGMKFGLWVEPENLNTNSDIFREHPEWIFQFPNRETNKYRKILNLANEGAYNHLFNSLSKLLEENEIDFIKWDQNNYLSEPGWMEALEGLDREARIRHNANVYRLIAELRKKFPDVMFETCASGGGRVDLGILSKMDQAWVSDNTDPIDRLFIQNGYSRMRPPNTMVSWVTSMTRHQPLTLEYRFDVSMAGVLGIGANISKWNEDDQKVAREKISLYKNIRHIVQKGNHYSLVSPFETNRSASQYVSQDKNSSLLFCYNMAHYLTGSQLIDRGAMNILLKGLHPETRYSVRDTSNGNEIGIFTGSFLMNIGVKWPVENRALKSKILQIDKHESNE